jgi:hypothetical protein
VLEGGELQAELVPLGAEVAAGHAARIVKEAAKALVKGVAEPPATS